jgi:hypothetical protein
MTFEEVIIKRLRKVGPTPSATVEQWFAGTAKKALARAAINNLLEQNKAFINDDLKLEVV